MNFFQTLVEDALDEKIDETVQNWAIENFDKEWLKEFMGDIKSLKQNFLESTHFPSCQEMLLLKFIFLLRQEI